IRDPHPDAGSIPVWAGAQLQIAKLFQNVVFLRGKTLIEVRIVQFLIAFRIAQAVERAEPLSQFLAAFGRELPPLRQDLRAHRLPLLGSQLFKSRGSLIELLLLLLRQPVPFIEMLPDFLLLLGRQAAEALVVLQEALSLFGAHLLQTLLPLGRPAFGRLLW